MPRTRPGQRQRKGRGRAKANEKEKGNAKGKDGMLVSQIGLEWYPRISASDLVLVSGI